MQTGASALRARLAVTFFMVPALSAATQWALMSFNPLTLYKCVGSTVYQYVAATLPFVLLWTLTWLRPTRLMPISTALVVSLVLPLILIGAVTEARNWFVPAVWNPSSDLYLDYLDSSLLERIFFDLKRANPFLLGIAGALVLPFAIWISCAAPKPCASRPPNPATSEREPLDRDVSESR
jgi:hypothetical protein